MLASLSELILVSYPAFRPSLRQQTLSSCLSLALPCFILTYSRMPSWTTSVLTAASPLILHEYNHLHFFSMFLSILVVFFSLGKGLLSFYQPRKSLSGAVSSISQRLPRHASSSDLGLLGSFINSLSPFKMPPS